MIISVNWLKKFTDIDMPIHELATLIGARLVEIESVKDLGAQYKEVIVAKIVSCEDIADSDHLHVTKIDDGGKAQGVERDEQGFVQVVCGAPNVREGLLVAWLPPNSIVPDTFGSAEPFVLGARQLRGYTSNGMLASARELDLFDDHEGILEIDKDAAPGSSFAELYELDDYLLDIENKSLTHRPDTFGVIGFAREVAGIQGKAFKTPAFIANVNPVIDTDNSVKAPNVSIDDPSLSDRYQAVVLSGAREGAVSPLQLQTYLSRSGVRPINAIVDVTNYLMLLTGQPLHAFDYDKLQKLGDTIHVRAGREGETLKLLDGRTINLSSEDIVIAAGETAVALAGAMGGEATEIDAQTKNIIIESATFNLFSLRSTQMRHGIFTEGITRFTKGQSAAQTAPVLAEAVRLIGEYTDAKAVSAVAEAYPGHQPPIALTISVDTMNDVLGSKFEVSDIDDTLQNVEFAVNSNTTSSTVTVPYWRQDIHIQEDIIEEVGRLNGFDSIETRLAQRDFTAVEPTGFDILRSQLRDLMTRTGANEVLTYSFIHGDLMRKVGQNPDSAYRITNSLSPELQYYRQSIVPSLLAQVHQNVKAGYDHFALYELNKFHTKQAGVNEEGVPKELDSFGFVITDAKTQGSAFYEAKRHLDFIARQLNIEFTYEPLEEDSDYPVTQPFEPKRSARVWEKETRERIGVIGEFKRSVTKSLKLPEYTAGFEIAPRGLLKVANLQGVYNTSSKFPGSERDICFQVDTSVTYDSLYLLVRGLLEQTGNHAWIKALDIYQAPDSQTKNITLRVGIVSPHKTLTGEEVATIITSIEQAARDILKATII